MSKELLDKPMSELRELFPSMKRALFSSFHIGGCQSCSYSDDESLQLVCEKNELNPDDVIKEIIESDKRDQEMMLSPREVNELINSDKPVLLLDSRTREEYEALKIEGAQFLTQELQNSLFTPENYEKTIILYDHTGQTALDTCSWFQGHGLKGTRILKGGIDLWSQEIDSDLPRYRLEID